MSSVIGVLTYRRQGALETFLRSVAKFCPGIPVAVFEDCANSDDTYGVLTKDAKCKGIDSELEAEVWESPNFTAFLGCRNVGVAAQSNKALKWFERQNATHLCLCNDDIEAQGNFPEEYAKAHIDLKIGLFCFVDPKVLGEDYKGPEVRVLGHNLRLVPRQTGCMMSITRELMQRIGYYDVTFLRMGQEHVDFNNRATMAGFINLRGKAQKCLDLANPSLILQIVRPSVSGAERESMDRYANEVIQRIASRYQTESWYRPYRLLHAPMAFGYGGVGISSKLLEEVGYTLVVDHNYHDQESTL